MPAAVASRKPSQNKSFDDIFDTESLNISNKSLTDTVNVEKKKRGPKKKTNHDGPPTGEVSEVISTDSSFFPLSETTSDATNRIEKPRVEKTIEQRYQKKTQLEHILLRPDSYVGSCDMHTQSLWVWEIDIDRMVNRQITFVPGLYKIFDEILVNAADVKAREENNTDRSKRVATTIKVDIDAAENKISVFNDGEGIPITIHSEHNVYVPELIFGHLLTSDNYDDTQARVTGGRNGYGAKLANIFSVVFQVECADSLRKKKFFCKWTDNMTRCEKPIIKDYPEGQDFVKVTFFPDLKKFHMEKFDQDILSLFSKRVYDVAGTTGLKVFLNSKRLPVKDFKSYTDLYFKPILRQVSGTLKDNVVADENETENALPETKNPVDSPVLKIYFKSKRWDVVISESDGQFTQVSFVNSICTPKGGNHVNHVTDQIVQAILKKANTKNKKGMEIKPMHVKHHIWIFVNCLIVNPSFDSQTKETLTTKQSLFGSNCILDEKTINAVCKSSILHSVLLWAKTKEEVELQKALRSHAGRGFGKERITGIPKLEDANDAGTKNSSGCTLILTEGDSAKTSCLAGLSVVGRDKFGVFPLKGKTLNVREATFAQKCDNKEVQNILTILGLTLPDKNNSNPAPFKNLRYGSLMLMTDQDPDGSHIKGLLINLIHYYWPGLLKMSGFLKEFVTPLVKVSKGEQTRSFFTMREYEDWKQAHNNGKGWKLKYYKGLGTSTDKEFKEYFAHVDRHKLDFVWSGEIDGESIDMAFNKNRAGDRKNWILNANDKDFVDHSLPTLTYSDFVNKELVLFSKYDTLRSIPCLIDGCKPGQRKVLYGVFRRNLRQECKVAQLTGYIAEHSAYHHGEVSLQSTIINMAQTFVGSNNINLLQPCGQFGSRNHGGKDASAARYIFTKLAVCTRKIFHELDDPLLEYQDEDGTTIDPVYYVPVIPIVLVNGASGIGTGWSCSLPNYNPRDVIMNIRRFLDNQPLVPMVPFYRGFTGTIEHNAKGSFESVGIAKQIDTDTVQITELPVKRWTQDYKDFLESELPLPDKKDPMIIDYRDNSTHDQIVMSVKLSPEKMEKALSEGLDKFFRLRSPISLSNMTLFGDDGKIYRYDTELDIINAFIPIRIKYYQLRKEYMMDKLEIEKRILDNKVRFVLMVITNQLCISNRRKNVIITDLIRLGFDKLSKIEEAKKKWVKNVSQPSTETNREETDLDDSDEASEFNYLLCMQLWSLTLEKVEALQKQKSDCEKQIIDLKCTSKETLWRRDLDDLEKALDQQDEEDTRLMAENAKFSNKSNKEFSLKSWVTKKKNTNGKAGVTKTKNIIEPKNDKITEPKNDKITESKNVKITESKNVKITEPNNDKITEPKNNKTIDAFKLGVTGAHKRNARKIAVSRRPAAKKRKKSETEDSSGDVSEEYIDSESEISESSDVSVESLD